MTNRVLNCVEGEKWKRDWLLPPIKITHLQRSALEEGNQTLVFSRALSGGPVLDQGRTSQCVGYSGSDVISDTPEGRGKVYNPAWIYEKAKLYDQWAGEDYEGTSISGACEALRKDGAVIGDYDPIHDLYVPVPKEERFYIHAYYKIDPNRVEEIKSLLRNERLWISIKVFRFFYTVGSQVDNIEGDLGPMLGGHALSLTGYKEENGKLYWQLKNSWGVGWGQRGYTWIDHELLKRILLRGGMYYLVTSKERAKELKDRYNALSKWVKFKIKFKKWWNSIF